MFLLGKEAENETRKRGKLEEAFAKVNYDGKMSEKKLEQLKDRIKSLKNENSGFKNRIS